MNRVILLVAFLLLLPACALAGYHIEGNPDSRPSVGVSIGKGWGHSDILNTGQLVPGATTDLDGFRMSVSLRLPIHRDITGEIGYLYDALDNGETDIVFGFRQRFNLVNFHLRFYF